MADKKNKKFSLRRLIFNDKYLIITSLLLAVVVWAVTSLSMGENTSKTITVSAPLSLSQKEEEAIGMKLYTDRDNYEIHVTISGAKYAIEQVSSSDISVKFDISNVNRTGEQEVPIVVTNSSSKIDFAIESYYPQTYKAFFDVKQEKTLDLNLYYDDVKTADGFVIGEPTIDEDKIIVSGPKTYVENITKANLIVVPPDDNNLTENYTTNCNITLESEDNEEFEESYITFLKKSDKTKPITSVSVTLPVVKKINVPVKVTLEDIPKGIKDSEVYISYSVETLSVGFINNDSVDELDIGSINFSRLTPGKNTFTFKTKDIKGITGVYDGMKEIEVTIYLDESGYEKQEVYLDNDDIEISGLADGKKARITNITNDTVTVYTDAEGSENDVSLTAKCDLSKESTNGRYPLTFKLDDDSAWVYGEYSVDVTIE